MSFKAQALRIAADLENESQPFEAPNSYSLSPNGVHFPKRQSRASSGSSEVVHSVANYPVPPSQLQAQAHEMAAYMVSNAAQVDDTLASAKTELKVGGKGLIARTFGTSYVNSPKNTR